MEEGRNTPVSIGAYWNVYHQVMFQGDAVSDLDPGLAESLSTPAGFSIGAHDQKGSATFVEIVREIGGGDPILTARCLRNVLAHEVGHQMGLPDADLGDPESLMSGCDTTHSYFRDVHLKKIREKGGF